MKTDTKKPLELYIHIPFCVKKCDYCDFLSFPADEPTQWKYTSALMKEISYYGNLMEDYEVVTIYFGGGTPSWLNEQWMLRILDVIGDCFQIDRNAEVSMECNPGTMTREKLELYYQNGINRLSIGLQSTDDKELKLLGRIHTYDQFLQIYEMARDVGYRNINVDLISGIPYQNLEKFARSLLRVIQLKPEHISAYSLIIEEGTPFYKKYKHDLIMQEAGMPTREIPSEEETYKIMKATQQLLAKHGYQRYEISNFARPGFACRHNLGYWNRSDYLGLGIGAASLIGNIRYTNTRDITAYIKGASKIYSQIFTDSGTGQQTMGINLHAEATTLTRQEEMEEFMFLGLRKTEGISRHDFFKAFDTPIEAVYQKVIEKLQAEGLVECRHGRVFLNDRGMDLSNYAMAEFLL